jgi:hypothetical protein
LLKFATMKPRSSQIIVGDGSMYFAFTHLHRSTTTQ